MSDWVGRGRWHHCELSLVYAILPIGFSLIWNVHACQTEKLVYSAAERPIAGGLARLDSSPLLMNSAQSLSYACVISVRSTLVQLGPSIQPLL